MSFSRPSLISPCWAKVSPCSTATRFSSSSLPAFRADLKAFCNSSLDCLYWDNPLLIRPSCMYTSALLAGSTSLFLKYSWALDSHLFASAYSPRSSFIVPNRISIIASKRESGRTFNCSRPFTKCSSARSNSDLSISTSALRRSSRHFPQMSVPGSPSLALSSWARAFLYWPWRLYTLAKESRTKNWPLANLADWNSLRVLMRLFSASVKSPFFNDLSPDK